MYNMIILTWPVMDLRGLYKKGSVIPVNMGVTSDRRCESIDIGFSIGRRIKGGLRLEIR